MGRSCFLTVFFVMALLLLSTPNGFGRVLMKSFKDNEQYAPTILHKESEEKSRNLMMELDYEEAGPNHNSRSGVLPFPPSQPAPSPQG